MFYNFFAFIYLIFQKSLKTATDIKEKNVTIITIACQFTIATMDE